MRSVWVSVLVLCLALWARRGAAEEFSWRPVAPRPAAVQPAAPPDGALPPAGARVVEADSVAPAAPAPQARLLGPRPVVRAQSADADAPPPVPWRAASRPAPAVPEPARSPVAKADDAARLADPPPPLPALLPPVPVGVPAVLPAPEAAAGPVARLGAAVKRVCCGAGDAAAPLPAPAPGVAPGGFAGYPTFGTLPPCDDQSCGDDGACPCDAEPARGHGFYASAEYLLWAFKNGNSPVLATTGSGAVPGALGQGGTTKLFGGTDSLDTEEHSGGRFTAGYWFDCCQTNGIEGSFFFLPPRSDHFTSALPLLARPFFNVALGQQSVELTSFPNSQRGTIHIDSPSELWGANLDWRHNLCCGCGYRVDLLAGFRFAELKEGLHIEEDVTFLPGVTQVFNTGNPFPAGTHQLIFDHFDTRNDFYGGEVGFDTELRRGRWSLDLKTKVALGDNHQVVNIAGQQVVQVPGAALQVFNGGLLALPSNSGHHVRNQFSVIPEVGLTLGYDLTDHVKVFAGYNFLYWSNVVRPGDQINPNLNPNLIPNFKRFNPQQSPPSNSPQPVFMFHDTNFWAQGITAGMEFKY